MGEKKGNLATALVLFIVVFLPLGSLFYLQKGFHYHKKIWDDMKSYGDFPDFKFSNASVENGIDPSIFKGYVSMVGFYNSKNEASFLKMYGQLYHQFKQDATKFIAIDLDGNFDENILEKYHLPKSKKFILADGGNEASILLKKLKIPDFSKEKKDSHFILKQPSDLELKSYPLVVLVDEYGEFRNYIPWNNKEGFDKLVEEMAILITHHELGDKKKDEK